MLKIRMSEAIQRQLAERTRYLIDDRSKAREMEAYGGKLTGEEFSSGRTVEGLPHVSQGEM